MNKISKYIISYSNEDREEKCQYQDCGRDIFQFDNLYNIFDVCVNDSSPGDSPEHCNDNDNDKWKIKSVSSKPNDQKEGSK